MKKEEKKKDQEEKIEDELEKSKPEAVGEKSEAVDELTELKKKAQEYLSGWKRCMADFENYKKRQQESQKDLTRYATQNIVLQLLPIVDNFHASTDHIPEDQKNSPWVIGIMHIQRQLEQVLMDNGVEEISAKAGDPFDPTMHEAVEDKECTHCESEKKFENKIKRVILRGYKMGERIIRAARVTVE